jgi:hypothetical protein
MISKIRMTQPAAPCGRVVFFAFARTGLNFPIHPMVASWLMSSSRMTRSRCLLAWVLALAACRHAPAPPPDPFTEVVGAWHRTALTELPPSSPPDPVPPSAIQRIRAATYEGPGKLDARVYQLTSPAVALDLAQRWTPAPDTVFFYADRFFVLIRWQTADRKSLHDFVGTLEKNFPTRR